MRIKGQSNLDAIEEVRGSDTSISSFVNGQSERDRSRRGDDFKGHDVRLEIRDGGMTPRSDEMFDYRRDSKDELIEDVEKDMHVAIPGRAHLPRSSW